MLFRDTLQLSSRILLTAMAIQPIHKLSGIEALRGLAASAVVLSHTARHVDKAYGEPALITAFQAGHAGVDLFFVISGFIILFVHHVDIGRPERLPHYTRRRLTRVLPLYWIALLLTLTMAAAGSHPLPSVGFLLWSASLLPTTQEPFLGIAWTLQFEVVFYVVFAVLIIWRAAGMLLLAAWAFTIIASSVGMVNAQLPGSLSGAYGIEFFLGMIAAHVVLRRQVPAPLLVAAVGLVLFGAVMVLESVGLLDGYSNVTRLWYGAPAACVVAGLAAAEQTNGLVVPSWLRVLGGASYSIYLFQFVFIGVVWQAWLKAGLGSRMPPATLFLIMTVSAVAGGVAVNRLVEQPLLRLIRLHQSSIRSATAFRATLSQDS